MHRKLFFLLIGWVFFFCHGSYGQNHGQVRGWEHAVESFDLKNGRNVRNNEAGYFLVLLKQGAQVQHLSSAELTVYRKGKSGYSILKGSSASLLEHGHLFEKVWQLNHRWKLSRNLVEPASPGRDTFTIKTTEPQKTLHILSALPEVKVLSVRGQIIRLACTYEQLLSRVIALEEVVYAGKEAEIPVAEGPVKDMNLVVNGINRIHHAYPEINGKGMTLSIQEMGFAPQDMDLLGREVPSALRAPANSMHATEMATIAAGAGNSFITGKGVAWAAQITSSDFADVLPDSDKAYQELDAWVQNHSYGTEIENFYGTKAEAFDESARANPALLHVTSSGNQGRDAGTGPYEGVSGFANLTGNFKMAKNILTVGAVDTLGRPMFFSSKGPAYDGRVKPELTAYSTAGSSNATALVSGLVVLLQQAYKEQEGSLPAAALLKAILINSARDAGPKGLDFETGYGNVNGFRALENLLAQRYFFGSIGQGESTTISLEVPAKVRSLKLTVVWTDPAARPGSDLALVNDLDMTLQKGTETWLPWVLDATPSQTSLSKAPVRGRDHLNTIEQVTVEQPEAGTYSIAISAYDIPEGVQDFYLAYQWEEEEQFSWAYPTGSDYMPYNGESTGYLRWESTMAAASGLLEYSLDGGLSWHLIDEAVTLESGAYRWEAPQLSGLARVRMTIGSQFFTTDAFALSRPLKTAIGFVCGDSILLQWNQLEQAQAYEVFTLGSRELESVAVIRDTLVVLDKAAFATRFFAVQPLFEGGTPAIRSVTFDYALQGMQCYLTSFFSELTPEQEMYLNLQLGTTYQVEEVAFERKVDGQWVQLGNAYQQGVSSYRFRDEAPLQGLNTYRARLRLANGETIVSEEDLNYYLSKPPFLVFPNPVAASAGLNVYSINREDQVFSFRLYNPHGKLVAESTLRSDREFIRLKGLPPGFYLYLIEGDGQLFRGRLVVE